MNREIVKAAKKGDLHYYWNIVGLPKEMASNVVIALEKEGKNVKSKGIDYKIIMW